MLLFNEGFVFSVPTSQNAKDNNWDIAESESVIEIVETVFFDSLL